MGREKIHETTTGKLQQSDTLDRIFPAQYIDNKTVGPTSASGGSQTVQRAGVKRMLCFYLYCQMKGLGSVHRLGLLSITIDVTKGHGSAHMPRQLREP